MAILRVMNSAKDVFTRYALVLITVWATDAQARRVVDATGHLKLFSTASFPAPYADDVPGALLAASGSSVVDSRLKLLWRPQRKLRIELHPTLTLTQGQASVGLSTGVTRSGEELLPLSYAMVDDPALQLNARLDRASLRWDVKRLRLTFGRQPITFGKGRVFTPLDLVSPFSPTTIDNSFKPGVDSIRLDWFRGMSGRITLVAAYTGDPGPDFAEWRMDRSTWAAHAKGSFGDNWELEGFSGWIYDEPVLGASVFYNGGFIGYYGDINITLSDDDPFGRLVIGAQYKPTEKTYVTLEGYAQSLGADDPKAYLNQLSSVRYQRGELVQLGRFYMAVIGSYQLAPLVTLSGAVLSNLTDPSILLMPSVNWSAANNASISMGGLAGFGARPSLVPGSGGTLQLQLSSEYGSIPVTAFIQGAFYF